MKKIFLNIILFLFPFFFLNVTQEYFVTNKLYLLGFGSLFLLLISGVELLLTKKISWQKNPFDNLILLFLTSVAVSTLFSSPNKIQALLNPNFGLAMMISLAVLYFYLSRNVRAIHESLLQSRIYHLGSIILSIITIIFYFQPFKNVALPQNLAFLKNPGFTPVGSQLDLAILLGFFIIIGIVNILKKGEKTSPLRSIIYHLGSIILPLTALFLTIYSLINPVGTDVINHVSTLILPPFRLSWFAALEILKNPASAIIGIGPDNFSAIFTRVKDFAYNQSPLWQINSFNVSRSAILQILTETGIFGLLTFGLLIFNAIKQLVKGDHKGSPLQLFLFLYLIICLLIFPPSLILWFLFFILIAELSKIYNLGSNINKQIIDLSDLLPICVGIVIISLGLIGASGYFLGRTYASEYFFKKSIGGIALNNAKLVYDNQRQAIILNPYIERFRSSFAQTNILIANNLALKNKDGKITEQDRQTITQAIQAGISEGKVVVSLNPQKAGNWQSLASIYANIINAAAGADVWTISAFQRAILADPQNPVYRVSLGGVYYSQNKYDDALRFFEQAISLKPDWPNASYNYAWANFQKKNYPQAVNALQATIKLIDPKLNKADYDKALKELEEFKKMLPNEDVQVDQSGEKNQSGSLNLPTPPTTQISPKLELPKEASPEAK